MTGVPDAVWQDRTGPAPNGAGPVRHVPAGRSDLRREAPGLGPTHHDLSPLRAGHATGIPLLSSLPIRTGSCNALIANGTVFPEQYTVDLHKTSGTFSFWYEAFSIPDRFIIRNENRVLFDQCVSGTPNGRISLAFRGSTSVITVTVLPNCQDPGPTEWEFRVFCD